MSRVAFTDEVSPAARNSGDLFPKLKLKQGEKARVVLLEGPERVYVHSLYEPKIENGKGVLVEKKRKDQSTYEAYDETFLKKFQCLGDEEVLFQSGVDVTHCPACKASTQFDPFKAPVPSYALNLIKYNTKADGDLALPFSVTALVWAFGPQKFEQIRSFAKEYGDLKQHDLVLGPCVHETYQKYDMLVSPRAAWQQDDSTKKLTLETFKANRIEDLTKVIAQEMDAAQVSTYLERIKHKWDIINGVAVSNTEAVLAAAEVTSTPDVSLGDSTPTETPAVSMDFDALLDGLNS